MPDEQQEIFKLLAAPFAVGEVKFKPAVVSGGRALALAYIDARCVQDRLDEVLGPGNWQDDYQILEGGSVVCRLRLRIDGEWITKTDVGSMSEQPDDGDKMKAAFSDSLKRAAVKFGIGRYLYRFPQQWCEYDQKSKKFINPPGLPDFARPTTQKAASHINKSLRDKTLPVLEGAAAQGREAARTAFAALSQAARDACKDDIDRLKKVADEADQRKAANA